MEILTWINELDQTNKNALILLSQMVTAIAAILIPLILFLLSWLQNRRRNKLAITNDTLRELTAFNRYYIGDVLTKIHTLARNSPEIKNQNFEDLTYEEIKDVIELKLSIEQILNQVNYICIGVEKKVFRRDLVEKVLKVKIKYIWNSFQRFAESLPQPNNTESWLAIKKFLG